MTWSSRDFLDVISMTAASAAQSSSETIAQLRCEGSFETAELFDRWREYQTARLPDWINIRIEDISNEALDLSGCNFADLQGQSFSVIIRKSAPKGVFCFFGNDGFRNGIRDRTFIKEARAAYIFEDFEPFSSVVCEFSPLPDDGALPALLVAEESYKDQIEAAKLTRYLTQNIVPPSISFWIVDEQPEAPSESWTAWQRQAVQELLLFPATEIWESEASLMLSFSGHGSGPRRRVLKVALDDADVDLCFDVLQEAVAWVAELPREASIRHMYLAAELAREWPQEIKDWSIGLPKMLGVCLEGAKAHYDAHLLETSGEVLKSLAELRKAVTTETSDTIKRTHDLAKALAASLAISVAVLLFRLPKLIDPSVSTDEGAVSQVIFGILCAWMVFSCLYLLIINYNFNKALEISQNSWHSKIHAVLPSREFQQIATDPLKKAQDVYFWGAFATTIVYIAAALALGSLAYDPTVLIDVQNSPPATDGNDGGKVSGHKI